MNHFEPGDAERLALTTPYQPFAGSMDTSDPVNERDVVLTSLGREALRALSAGLDS
jgi:hypothetical protein